MSESFYKIFNKAATAPKKATEKEQKKWLTRKETVDSPKEPLSKVEHKKLMDGIAKASGAIPQYIHSPKSGSHIFVVHTKSYPRTVKESRKVIEDATGKIPSGVPQGSHYDLHAFPRRGLHVMVKIHKAA